MFFELRQYKTKPGMRDAWVKTMEEKILPFHASKGVVVSGSFTGRDDDNTYVWLRRFDSQEQKETFAKTIAESDYWKNEVVPGHPGNAGPGGHGGHGARSHRVIGYKLRDSFGPDVTDPRPVTSTRPGARKVRGCSPGPPGRR